ncbi:MAG: hypothetical protein PHR36_04025 [Patescibacteria group bacterium]|nr:hypothetical protein [Patescibacteria group bacterium]
MNIFLIGWDDSSKVFLEIAKRLEDIGHKIVYWSGGNRTDLLEQNRKNFPQTIFHNRLDAMSCRPAKELEGIQFEPPSEEIIKKLYEAESILSTLKQFEKLKISSFEKNNLYHRYLEYWLGVIKRLKPEVIIFAMSPHNSYNYIVLSIARLLKIRTIMFDHVGISDRYLLINDYVIGSRSLKKEIDNNRGKQYKIDDLSQDIKEYYKKQTDEEKDAIYHDFKILKNRYSGFNFLLIKAKIILKSLLDLSIFKKTYLFFLKKFGENFKKEYEKLCSKADFDKKFIYVPLHYQPECATAPLGGVFVDQILMIKILAAAIPDDWEIYVKEHPNQWLTQGLNYTHFRYKGYYEAIAKIKKVKIVSMETPASELIKKSRAVATVTGSAGREAILRQRPALVFAYPAYRYFTGAFMVNDVASCRAALAKINSGFAINQQEVINCLYSLDKVSFHAFFEKNIENLSKISPEENTKNILGAIISDLENNIS